MLKSTKQATTHEVIFISRSLFRQIRTYQPEPFQQAHSVISTLEMSLTKNNDRSQHLFLEARASLEVTSSLTQSLSHVHSKSLPDSPVSVMSEYSNIFEYSTNLSEYLIFKYEYCSFGKRIYSSIRNFGNEYSNIRYKNYNYR